MLASISRIERDNRIEIPIDVANRCSMKLSIVGTNKDHRYLEGLKKISGPNIEFLGEIREPNKISVLKRAKILLHATDGKFRDYLDYSILDGMAYGCVPLCITPDAKQFEEISTRGLGMVVNTSLEAISAVHEILDIEASTSSLFST